MTIVFISIIMMMTFLIFGVSVPFAFGSAALFLILVLDYPLSALIATGFANLYSLPLMAICMFVMAGGFIEKGKIGGQLVGFVEIFVGKIRGGLGVASVIASGIFGAISGSAAATLSCIGSIVFPKLREQGYEEGHYASLVINASPLGLLIPPSSIQILYAWSATESVLACFLSTIIPGITLAIGLCIVNLVMARKNPDIKPDLTQPKFLSKLGWKKTRTAIPALLMPVIILGGIYGGVMTPTESAAIATLYSIPVAISYYRGMKWSEFKDVMIETVVVSGAIMCMLFCVTTLSRLFVLEGLPNALRDFITGISNNKYMVLLMVNIFMIIIGMLMDDTSGTLLCTPLLLPLVKEVGVSGVQFAAILGVNLGMGNITPPTAPLLYLGCRLANVPVAKALKPSFIMIGCAWMPALILTTYIPAWSLTIPKLAGLYAG